MYIVWLLCKLPRFWITDEFHFNNRRVSGLNCKSEIGRVSEKLLELVTQSDMITAVLPKHAKARDALIQFKFY